MQRASSSLPRAPRLDRLAVLRRLAPGICDAARQLCRFRSGPRHRSQRCRRRMPQARARAWRGRLCWRLPSRPPTVMLRTSILAPCVWRARRWPSARRARRFAFAMQGLGSGAIAIAGSPELRAAILPKARSGEWLAAFALSEKHAGSDVAAMTCSARQDGDDYVIDGEKTWISNGGIADFYTLFARTGEAPGARGISAFVVFPDDPGFSIAERIDVIAPASAGDAALRELSGSQRTMARGARRRLQDCDADARYFSRLRCGRSAGLRATRA